MPSGTSFSREKRELEYLVINCELDASRTSTLKERDAFHGRKGDVGLPVNKSEASDALERDAMGRHFRFLQISCLFFILRNLGVQGAGGTRINWIHEDFEQFQRGDIVGTLACGTECTVKVVAKPGLPMIFNSSQPTGQDYDLGTPNSNFGGPGIGAGGKKSNSKPRGNVLIISEDGDRANPDDEAGGGRITFLFSEPMLLLNIGFLDNDEGFMVRVWDSNNRLLYRHYFAPLGDNSFQYAPIRVGGGTKMMIDLNGSGAVTELKYARLPIVDLEHRTELPKADSYLWGKGGIRVSIDGNTIIAGNYAYISNGTEWIVQALLDEFGDSCRCFRTDNSLSGNKAIVGNDLYVRTGTNWTYQATLGPAGNGTAISGNLLVVGNEVYRWNQVQWELEATLTPNNSNESFGGHVAVDGDTIVVAGLTGLQVFVYDGSVWSKQATITVDGYKQGSSRFFDIEGNTIALSTALYDNVTDPDWLSVYTYIFDRQGTKWIQQARLDDDFMGHQADNRSFVSLALSHETVAIGIFWFRPDPWRWMYGGGSISDIHFFRRYFGSSWVSLPCNDPSLGANGIDVDLSGSTLVIGTSDFMGGWAYVHEI